ncbi:hypothetical protein [Frankia sp. QA3]|uniref:hypothetical protein n=1 Tax=Frankia sp. QA3 TaxID=710111 RepID=UPI000269C49C|nr:hypothetical protein [Frankia sp. QA3]EIV94349.1 hypothetical protein FraQA3DRAFT_4098 [Frankia sp. QA3]
MELSRRQVLTAASVATAGALVSTAGLTPAAAAAATATLIGTTVAAPAIVGPGPSGQPFQIAFAGGGGYGAGTPNHLINIAHGNDLVHPRVLPYRTGDALGLAWDGTGMSTSLTLAWTHYYDRTRRLNLGRSANGATFDLFPASSHTCLGGVALTRHDNAVIVGWAGGGGLGGGAPDGRVNVAALGGRPVTLPWRTPSAPALAGDPGVSWPDGGPRLYVCWRDAEGYLYFTYCGYRDFGELLDRRRVQRVETRGKAERSSQSPALAFSGDRLYLAWPAVDRAHHINFKVIAGAGAGQKMTGSVTASSALAMESYYRGSARGWTGRYVYRGTDRIGGVYLTDAMPL